jgi:DNA invertase Pin-like site-specific DNA recombinase
MRVSTRDQSDDSQLDELTAAGCERIFEDKGVSGKLASRPQWDQCLEYLRPGDALVITRLSRAGRSLRNLIEVTDHLEAQGIDLIVLKDHIDTTTPGGRLIFHIMAAIGEFQRDLIVEGTREGLIARRARGRTGGRRSKLTARQVEKVIDLVSAQDPDGNHLHTVQEVADLFKVSRPTIYAATQRRLTPKQIEAAKAAHAASKGGQTVEQIADRFGVTRQQVADALGLRDAAA